MECPGGREQAGAMELRNVMPAPSLPAQERVDHPDQEREQGGGVVVRSHRMAVRRSVSLVVRVRVLRRGVFEERDVRQLVQRSEGSVAQEKHPHEEERQETISGRTREQALSQAATV
jgi:hypothetical protein